MENAKEEHVKENQTKNVDGLQNTNAQLIVEDLKDFLKNNIVSMGAKQEENKRNKYEIKTS